MTREIDFVNLKTISGKHKSNDLFNWAVAEKITTENHSSIVGSKPLSQSCGRNSNAASTFRAVWA